MLKSTPEYVTVHLQNLSDRQPKAGPELVARHRRERRARMSRVAASFYHGLGFRRKDETSEASNEARPAI